MKFEDTKIAFSHKTTRELIVAKYMFKILSYPVLLKLGKKLLQIALYFRFPVEFVVKPTIYKHFVGGKSIEDCKKIVNKLSEYNIKSILDYSVEAAECDNSHERTFLEVMNSIQHAAEDDNVTFTVFKFSGIVDTKILEKVSENIDLTPEENKAYELFKLRFNELCKMAYNNNTPILVDAEESWFQAPIDSLVMDNMIKYNKDRAIVYNTYQMYQKGNLEKLERDFETLKKSNVHLGVKLVRGAYLEKENQRAVLKNYETPIFETKELTDMAYNNGLEFCINNIEAIYLFSGTHNEKSSYKLLNMIKDSGISMSDERVVFSQLYGMSDHISFNLSIAGYNVSKYVPYGSVKEVLPYLIRRAEENTSVRGQTGRELQLIYKELKRRKSEK